VSRRFYPTEGGARDVPWMLLYAVTAVVQAMFGVARLLLFFFPVEAALALSGHKADGHTRDLILYVIAFGPIVWSLTALVYPFGAGRYWQAASGGRAPSERERQVVDTAIAELQACDLTVRAPGSWFVIDDGELNAAALGDTMMVTTGLLHDRSLTAVVAHELGHLNSTDGHLTVALGRLAIPASIFMRVNDALAGAGGCFTGLFLFAGQFFCGLLGLIVVRPLWDAWFRAREFKADAYAARLGLARELADALEHDGLQDDRPTPFRLFSGATHPYTEHRIEALHNYDRRDAALIA